MERSATPRAANGYLFRLTLVVGLAGVTMWLLWWWNPRQLRLPLCALHATTGLYCPGCGATRATHDLLHGQWLSAVRNNALWVFSLPLALYLAASEARFLACGRPLPGHLTRNRRFLVVAGTVAVLFTVLRNVPLYPLVLLAPPG
jgi:hypothetical protein